MEQNDRLALLLRILDPEDYRFIRAYDFRIEAQLRRERMRIYRGGLTAVARDILDAHRARLSNISAAGRWEAYPRVMAGTASMMISVAKLWAAGLLFGLRLPAMVNIEAARGRLEQFLTAEAASGSLYRSRA